MIQKESEKFFPSAIFEGMTSISALLQENEANPRRIERVWIAEEKRRSKAREIAFLQAKAREKGFSVEFVPMQEIESMAIGKSHGGILAFCTDRPLPSLTSSAIAEKGFYLYLEGVEDPYNFGYAIRSLYLAGVDGVILPERNWMSAAGVVARASAGTSERMPLFTAEPEEAVRLFRERGYRILCAGIRDSVSLFDGSFAYPILLVIGGEKRGISRTLLELADDVVRIDYGREFRGSLSAASAAAVMAFEIMRQNR